MSNKQVVIASRVEKGSPPKESHFAVQELKVPTESDLKEGEILLRTLYLSVDPYMRSRLSETSASYTTPFELNEPGSGSGVGKVIATKNSNYQVGDILTAQKDLTWPWKQYVVFTSEKASKFHKLPNDFPPEFISATIGWLGMPGLTAYFGLLENGNPKDGETLVVSGAAGAVGSVVGQIAKFNNLKTIGIVGTEEKEKYCRSLGYDDIIIYKDKSRQQLIEELKKLAPNGVDIYFDNVGGEISNAVISVLNEGARVPICGQISAYNTASVDFPEDVAKIVEQRKIQRGWFMVFQFVSKFDEAWKTLVDWAKQGKLKCQETTYIGIEQLPKAFVGLFSGDNVGKAVVAA